MNNAAAELFAAMAGIALIGAIFAWFAFLPALGILWLIGWI